MTIPVRSRFTNIDRLRTQFRRIDERLKHTQAKLAALNAILVRLTREAEARSFVERR